MSRLHRQKMRQRFEADAGAGNRGRDRSTQEVDRVEARFTQRGQAADVEQFVARGQAAQAAVDKVIAKAKKPAKRAKRKAASRRR